MQKVPRIYSLLYCYCTVYNTPINLEKYQYLIKQAAAGKTSTVAKATVTTPVPEVAAVETAAVEQ